jgi:hypothetical protein
MEVATAARLSVLALSMALGIPAYVEAAKSHLRNLSVVTEGRVAEHSRPVYSP